jgi:hypothetical protein
MHYHMGAALRHDEDEDDEEKEEPAVPALPNHR